MAERRPQERAGAPRTLRQRAIALLARREYARAELAARLLATGATREEVEPVLDEIERLGYLSDARYAAVVVRSRAGSHARRAIAQSLRERGVAKEVANEALAAIDPDEFEHAKALWQRRFGTAPADDREKARQLRFLVARGFPASVAFRVLKAAGAVVDEP